ncbi:MAG: IPT/TIG domain-containing protein [Solirubrobacteraceae bacterium]
MGIACSGEGQQPTRPLLRFAAAVLTALALAVVAGWSASAASASEPPTSEASVVAPAEAPPSYRAQRVCGAPRPGAASCAAMRLVAASLTPAELRASAATQAGEAAAGARPAVTYTSPFAGYLTPQDLHDAYSLPDETAASSTQTIAVIDAFDDPTAEADLSVYDEQFGLPACTSANGCFRKVNEEGKASPLPAENGEWAGEISIDVQMAHAVCQGCHVLLVEASSEEFEDLGAAVNAAVKAGATEISNSYAGPEEPAFATLYAELGASFYDHPGVVVTASSGDCGYLNEACAGEPGTANFPADSPDVVAVGGTSLVEKKETWRSTVWDEGGSGCSQIFAAPAWQSAVANFSATGCGAYRSVADVAAIGNPNTGVDVYDSTPEGNGNPTGWTVFGGTSVASPIVAAEFALAGGSGGVAYPAATLYLHTGEGEDLYDVVAGSNGSCGTATSCQAAVGFDGPSGVGSPIGLGAFSTSPGEEHPELAGFTPSSGITGSTVDIEGTGLGAVSGVEFGALPARFKVLSTTRIEATVPNGASAAHISLKFSGGTVASKRKFTPTLSVTVFSPHSGGPGTVVTIKGIGFNSSSTVRFGGVVASVKTASAKKLKVKVPAGALAGAIAVTNTSAPVGTVLSASSFTP